jgi:hypothetical protein
MFTKSLQKVYKKFTNCLQKVYKYKYKYSEIVKILTKKDI